MTFRQRLFARTMAKLEAQSNELYREVKVELFRNLSGEVLEIGPGTGVNLPLLPAGIRWMGIEPNQAMHHRLRQRAGELGMEADLRTGASESLPAAAESFDAVVSTTVLCSVSNLAGTLGEIRRVLRPGGRFVFLEHVADRPGTLRRRLQKALPYTPWHYFSDGCDPGRDIAAAIENAGFSRVECRSYMQEGSGIIIAVNRPHISGHALR